MPVKAPVSIPSPAANWSGFHLGVNAGYGWGGNNAGFTGDGPLGAGNDLISRIFDGPLNFNQITRFQSINSQGVVCGVQIGYDGRFARVWVAGVEADFQGAGLRGSFTRFAPAFPVLFSLNAEQRLNWFGTVRGRLGYLVDDRLLVFGTAGLAYGQTETNANFVLGANSSFVGATTAVACVGGAPCLGGRNSAVSAGWTAGAGAEWTMAENTSLKLEYLHIGLLNAGLLMTAVAPSTGTASVTANSHSQFDIVRVGANFRF
jgi:outer membrane immunogenic protein